MLLSVRHLSKHFVLKATLAGKPAVHVAVDDVSFDLDQGEILGLVGESGSGKTTISRCVQGLIRPTSGEVLLNGRDIFTLPRRELQGVRRRVAFVFQDPFASLNPRLPIWRIVAEPLEIHEPSIGRTERRRRVAQLLDEVGLPQSALERFPHEFSGGQRQRIGIARALAASPDLIIADEPVSALDVSVQAQILNLLVDLRTRRNLAMLFVSHDLEVVRYLCDRVAVLFRGRLVETGTTEEVVRNPQDSYTRALIAAVPRRHRA
jgi:ABC-type oligopeptide transport system ATPase subunit